MRYWADGRQREKSFAVAREARDFQIKVDHDVRARIFVDDRAGRELFGECAEAYLARLAVVDRTRATYRETWSRHPRPRWHTARWRRWRPTGTAWRGC